MPKKVLIVEDYEDTREMMKTLIESLGYDVIEAIDGYEALEKAKALLPDLILMDLMMPVMDGFEAAQFIREYGRLHKVPIFAVTGFGNLSHERVTSGGFDEVFAKPLDFEDFEAVLRRYLDDNQANG